MSLSSWPFPGGRTVKQNVELLQFKEPEMCIYRQVKPDLSIGTDESGLQEIASAPGVLGLPQQVSGRVVSCTARCSPDLQRSQSLQRSCHRLVIVELLVK